jgi:hypothetical protein
VHVLVIGGGIAGLVTANRAAELGRRTVVLEKGTADRYLCSSRYTGGTFHIGYTDVLAGEDKLVNVIETATRGFARKDVALAIARDSSRLVRWLQGEGIRFMNLGHYHTFVLAPPSELPTMETLIRARLADRGLEVNEEKSASAAPGMPWDFLGFRYERGMITLAPHTERKLKAKTTRLARHLLRWRERRGASARQTVDAFVRRTNRRLYGVPVERADFSWATWFLPMLDDPRGLERLDHHVQRETRYAATGRRTASARSQLPYSVMNDAGYLPLVTAFWSLQQGAAAYDALVATRTQR